MAYFRAIPQFWDRHGNIGHILIGGGVEVGKPEPRLEKTAAEPAVKAFLDTGIC